MKVFTSSQIHDLDKYTIEHESVSSIDLMERTAKIITKVIIEEWQDLMPVVVFAGSGNNGGDSLAVARMMAEKNYKVTVFLFNIHNHLSEDCEINKQRLIECNRVNKFTEITVNFDPPALDSNTLVIDGLFGSGLNRPLEGGFASLVKYINQSQAHVVSIDMPSGLMTEDNTYNVRENIINAELTLTLQQKKLSMLLADNQCHIGRLKVLDIRLSADYMAKTDTPFCILEESDIYPILRYRDDFVHKGNMGNALIIAGCYGMAGAAILATKACLKSGPGKVTTVVPEKNYQIMQMAVPEAILQIDPEEEFFTEPVDTSDFDALGIGSGLGKQENTAMAMITQLRNTKCPIVADADAINILASHHTWMQELPKGIIMTPHPKEFDQLSGTTSNGCYDRLMVARSMAERFHAYIIIKGHYSALCLPDRRVIFNSTGNSGMATAGTGDVLAGIITGLLARGYNRKEACILGMYLHGLAGDIAVESIGKESLMASDLINFLPQAFCRIYK